MDGSFRVTVTKRTESGSCFSFRTVSTATWISAGSRGSSGFRAMAAEEVGDAVTVVDRPVAGLDAGGAWALAECIAMTITETARTPNRVIFRRIDRSKSIAKLHA